MDVLWTLVAEVVFIVVAMAAIMIIGGRMIGPPEDIE